MDLNIEGSGEYGLLQFKERRKIANEEFAGRLEQANIDIGQI